MKLVPEATELGPFWRDMGGRAFYILLLPQTLGILLLLGPIGAFFLKRNDFRQSGLIVIAGGILVSLIPFAVAYDERLLPLAVVVSMIGAGGLCKRFPVLARGPFLAALFCFLTLVYLPLFTYQVYFRELPDMRGPLAQVEDRCRRSDAPLSLYVSDWLARKAIRFLVRTEEDFACLRKKEGFSINATDGLADKSHLLLFHSQKGQCNFGPRIEQVDFEPLWARLESLEPRPRKIGSQELRDCQISFWERADFGTAPTPSNIPDAVPPPGP